MSSSSYLRLADGVLLLHFSVVLFVVGGLLAVMVGNWRGWRWVNGLWFRLLHLIAIGVVVFQAWLGAQCPLTTLESWLRSQAGGEAYSQSFIGHWLQQWLFYQAPAWLFVVVYTLFALLVVASWWCYPPRRGE